MWRSRSRMMRGIGWRGIWRLRPIAKLDKRNCCAIHIPVFTLCSLNCEPQCIVDLKSGDNTFGVEVVVHFVNFEQLLQYPKIRSGDSDTCAGLRSLVAWKMPLFFFPLHNFNFALNHIQLIIGLSSKLKVQSILNILMESIIPVSIREQ